MEKKSAKDKDKLTRSFDFQMQRIPWKRILLTTSAILAALVLLFLCMIWYLIATAPDLDSINVSPTGSATYICDEDGNQLRKLTLAASNRDIVDLEDIAQDMQDAIIAIEDERFYEHSGIDLRGIARAFVTGIAKGSFSEGASTITQQLIKNSVFTEWTQEDSFADRFRRKVQEQYLALQLEKEMAKEEILENYLNTINFGAGCYGVQAASRRYFGKDASELTLSESAVLAAIPQNPSSLNPIRYPENNRSRQETILNYMLAQGYITQAEQKLALADDVYLRIHAYDESYEEETVYSWYEDALIDQVIETLVAELGCTSDQAYRAVYSGGLRIFSAQDAALQQICDEEFQNPDNFPEGTLFGVDYALSVADENGLVTHYGSDALRSWIRKTINPHFDLMCVSEEVAQSYADAFREHILEEYAGEISKENDSEVILDSGDSQISTLESDSDDINNHSDNGSPENRITDDQNNSFSVLGERLTLSPQPQASLVLIDQETGFVRALVGGRGEKTASLTLNRASETLRQPGSTFKILTAYAPALDAYQQTLATTYENEPYEYTDGTPVSNWDVNDYSGSVTIREAITRSINVVAVKCITDITPRVGFDYAQKFGITTLHESYRTDGSLATDIVQPLALGGITEGVSNLELCGAYASIANGGLYTQPRFFTKILDRHGDVIIDYSSDTFTRILQADTSYLLTSAMRDVISHPQGTAYGSIYAAGQPVAGKTGTTSNYKDIWFVGYTPYYTCSVWGGYDNNEDLPDSSGYHSYNKTLWSAVMNRIHAELPYADFERPENIVSVTLCSESHRIAVADACPHTYTEYFVDGTQPENMCDFHEPVPETEPIIIYQDLLDQLLTETESESDTETADSESETADSESETMSSEPESVESESETASSEPDTDESGTTVPDSGVPDYGPGIIESEAPAPGSGTTESEIQPSGSGTTGTGTAGAASDTVGYEPLPPGNDWSLTQQQPDTSSLEDLINRLHAVTSE